MDNQIGVQALQVRLKIAGWQPLEALVSSSTSGANSGFGALMILR